MKCRLLPLFLLISAWSLTGKAQVLSIQQVVDEVLKNNFEGKIAGLSAMQAEIAATPGNAGLHPSVQLNAGGSYSNNNTEIVFANNLPRVKVDGAENNSVNASLGLNYTLFSGFANLRRFEQLKLQHDLSEEQLQLTLENAVITTIGLYLDLARFSEDLENLKANLRLSAARLTQIRRAQGVGTAGSLDLMSAQVDYNQDSSALLNLQNQIGGLKRQINFFMGREIGSTFEADTSRKSIPSLILPEILEQARSSSTLLILANLQSNAGELGFEISKAMTMPQINLNSSYGTVNTRNAAGIVLEQNNLGFNGGISLTLPIYNGGKIRTAVGQARIEMEKNQINRDQVLRMVEKEVYDHWFNLEHFKKLYALEQENIRTAELRMNQAERRFALGQISSLDYRESQLALLAARSRLNTAEYQAMKAAYQLYRLNGSLITQ